MLRVLNKKTVQKSNGVTVEYKLIEFKPSTKTVNIDVEYRVMYNNICVKIVKNMDLAIDFFDSSIKLIN